MSVVDRSDAVGRLREAIRSVEEGPDGGSPSRKAPTGWPPIDAVLRGDSEEGSGGLVRGAVHEWIGEPPDGDGPWQPPLCLLTSLAKQASSPHAGARGWVVWVGRDCWPSVHTLGRGDGPPLWRRSLLVDPPGPDERLWSIDLSIRSPAASAVVADGRQLEMAATRRLQLAARKGDGVLLLARSADEGRTLSAAATRWRVRPVPGERPRWRVTLWRRKGTQPARVGACGTWELEWDRATGPVAVSAELVGGPPAEGPVRRTA